MNAVRPVKRAGTATIAATNNDWLVFQEMAGWQDGGNRDRSSLY